MSVIVQNAKPIFLELIKSESYIDFSEQDQDHLRKFLALTAINADAVSNDSSYRYFTKKDRFNFKEIQNLESFESMHIFNITDSSDTYDPDAPEKQVGPWYDSPVFFPLDEKGNRTTDKPIYKSIAYVFGCVGIFTVFKIKAEYTPFNDENYNFRKIITELLDGQGIQLFPHFLKATEDTPKYLNLDFNNLVNAIREKVAQIFVTSVLN